MSTNGIDEIKKAFIESGGMDATLAMMAQARLNRMIIENRRNNPPPKIEKIPRNDPCPCGSGKKYKKCCIGD